MDFSKIDLKPLSWQILSYIYGKEPLRAEEIAQQINLTTRQVDAAITKSLIRYGFCVREARLTRLMKKEYNIIKITRRGSNYVEWRIKTAKE